MIRKFIIFFVVLSMAPFMSSAEDPSVSANLSSDTIMIGDQIKLDINIQTLKTGSTQYMVASDGQFILPGIEVLAFKADTSIDESTKNYHFSYLITSFDSGSYMIPGIPILSIPGIPNDTLYTNPLHLRVNIPPVDTTASVKDIKAPINTPFSISELRPYRWYFAGIILLILLIVLAVRFFRKKNKPEEKPEERIPPHEKALKQLDYLKAEKLWQRGAIKEHYTILSDAVRVYIEERYQIDAMESITSEILYKFRKYAYDDSLLLELLEDLLQLSDLVKFAKEDPSPAENETNLNKAYIFIEKTWNGSALPGVENNEKESRNV